jgi:dethiobiotin synthetase
VARSYLITGTDTGVGKTTVASAIAAALALRGHDVGVAKPVETGCQPGADGTRLPADALQLRWAAGRDDPIERVCPWRFAEPLSPNVAARREHTDLQLTDVVKAVRAVVRGCQIALVEGAGGLLSPVTDDATFADVARACNLRVIVVVGNRLGALNHARLTLDWASDHGLDVVGYIVNALAESADLAAQTNVAELRALLGPPLGVLPFISAIGRTVADRQRLAAVAEQSIELRSLLG